ncbi:MAG: helix-turn-helix transcriptional regulator [Chloroflexi bacterium]|nr:helix-turn-helix transcriptional regulator [Chloroflexota bacterium]
MTKKQRSTAPQSDQFAPLPDESLGEYLRRLRLIRGMDLGDVSSQTPRNPDSQHVSQSYLSQLELGRAVNPSRERLISLAHVLNVPETWILEKAGFTSGQLTGELDPRDRDLLLRAAQLSKEDRSVLDVIIDSLLLRRKKQ